MVGTTIAPWMMFFAQSNVVEKGVTVKDLFFQRIDAITGAVVACIIAWFIIVTTGAVLFPQGIEIESAADAAMALGPPLQARMLKRSLPSGSLRQVCSQPVCCPSPPRSSSAKRSAGKRV